MDVEAVKAYFTALQERIVAGLETFDGKPFLRDDWTRPQGGGGVSRLIEEGNFFERGGVNFSHVTGAALPASATAHRPELAGRRWEALGVSLVLHPRNPYCPTSHMNVRFFIAYPPDGADPIEDAASGGASHREPPARGVEGGGPLARATPQPRAGFPCPQAARAEGANRTDATTKLPSFSSAANSGASCLEPPVRGGKGGGPIWWFGGGMDLTPYYGFEEDCVHFHRVCKQALDPFGPDVHARYKRWCDEYFFLKHRNEPRGIGGIFFDDLNEGGFERCFALTQSIGDHFLAAYLPICEKRRDLSYGERERDFQLYRRGRYVEFNLVWDRGTLFGLQSGGRTEAILMSLPPLVKWRFEWHPEPGSAEEKLYTDFLPPRDWL